MNKNSNKRNLKSLLILSFLGGVSLTSHAEDYQFLEHFYGADEDRRLIALHENTCAEPNPAWVTGGFAREYRMTLKKAGIAEGFSKVTRYSQFASNQVFGAGLPLVIGERYELSVDYYGKIVGGGGLCVGSSAVRSLGTKEFRYDVHNEVLTFPVDINLHSRKLHHKATDECFYPQLVGATAFDTRVRASACDSSPDLAFEIIDAKTGYDGDVRIRSQITKQCISPQRYTPIDGSPVRLSSCLDDKNTVFKLRPVKDDNQTIPGEYYIKHKATDTCLYNYDVDSTAHLWTCWESPNQIFILDQF